jgi:anti-sigma regulatory factor (Ser/Thr protein kinase)
MNTPIRLADDRVWLPATQPANAGGVRRAAAVLGREIGLPDTALADLAIISTEVATNLARHADDGVVLLRLVRTADAVGVEIVATDRGPGMYDVDAASADGYSTSGTLGIGLGAIARMSTELDMYSHVGAGTVLAVSRWTTPPPPTWYAGVRRPITGETACGDGYAVREVNGRRQLLLCDGLGHGPLAAMAGDAAVAAFPTAPTTSLKDVLTHLDTRIAHTRGAVAGVAELDPDHGVIRFAGIGNISATIWAAPRRRTMVSLPGIIGQQRREILEFEYPMPPQALIIMHSDGLTDRWDLADYPNLTDHSPIVVAAILMRDAARRRDDAAVLVARA